MEGFGGRVHEYYEYKNVNVMYGKTNHRDILALLAQLE
jgi:hypothetical protein